MKFNNKIANIVQKYRKITIEGKLVDLVPFTMAHSDHVIEIRNKEKNRYFLNQTFIITPYSQAKWYESYLKKFDDIYWCVYTKDNCFIGTIRIYNIDEQADTCIQGSLMLDEEYSSIGPYAIEVELLSLDFAFNVLRIGNVINENRVDNKIMNNLTKKLGFRYIKNTQIGGVDYKYYLLSPADYEMKKCIFENIIEYWEYR